MSAVATILTQITEALAEFDAKLLVSEIEWAHARVAATQQFWAAATKEERRNTTKFYANLWATSGGKTWYDLLTGRSPAGVEEVMVKNNKSRAEKRNHKIAAQLTKAGITSVLKSDWVRSSHGFDGTFLVQTEVGQRAVTINTILAGGYNIQCAHLRCLVKVSK